MQDFDVGKTRSLVSNRRGLLRNAGLGSAFAAAFTAAPLALGLSGRAEAATKYTPSDVDILNFALNLEYLEAEYYLHAVNGAGLPAADTGGVGKPGRVLGGSAVPFKSTALQQFAAKIAEDEFNHVKYLRSALGGLAVARPKIDLNDSFTILAVAAGLIEAGQTFNPFADELSFLLGAYIFEDVGVTAYNGAAPLIQSKTYLGAAASILAVEAYHAGSIRTVLFELRQGDATAKISAARAAASGAADDQGVVLNGVANITPTDANGLAFSRTTAQVLNIVYIGGASGEYGFFPEGLNGAIN